MFKINHIYGIKGGLYLSNTGAVPLTVSNMTGRVFDNNNGYGIYGIAINLGTTTVNYTGASFSGSEADTNQNNPGNNVTWISD